jgi:hypothetical protein
LNGGTFNANAPGFKIDALGKLTDTKANVPKMTLMHYLVKFIDEKYPNLREFTKELPSISKATRVSLPTITMEMKQLKDDLRVVEKNVSKMKKKKDQAVKFKEVMGVRYMQCKACCLISFRNL